MNQLRDSMYTFEKVGVCGNLKKVNKKRAEDGREKNGILLPKLFWSTVRKNCSSDREQL